MSLCAILKRIFDVMFSLTVLIVLSPIYLITSIIIKLTSPGPIFYRANRVGKNGEIFTCYKFRSMKADSGKVAVTTLENDDRIYAFGRLIRKTKIDELPQFYNVLIGDMSIVGPRPEDEENAELVYIGKYEKILTVKPGITSIASLYDYTHGEKYQDIDEYSQNFLPQKMELELFYVEHRTTLYDIKIILKTCGIIFCIIFGRKKFQKPKELLYIDKGGFCNEKSNEIQRV